MDTSLRIMITLFLQRVDTSLRLIFPVIPGYERCTHGDIPGVMRGVHTVVYPEGMGEVYLGGVYTGWYIPGYSLGCTMVVYIRV